MTCDHSPENCCRFHETGRCEMSEEFRESEDLGLRYLSVYKQRALVAAVKDYVEGSLIDTQDISVKDVFHQIVLGLDS